MATILVVDDSALMRRVLSHLLCTDGHAVVTASDGHEALSVLAVVSVDLLLVDLLMPGMDGLTLVRHLHKDSKYRSLPLVIVTSCVDATILAAVAAAGVDGFLAKPVEIQELHATINRLIQPSAAPSALPAALAADATPRPIGAQRHRPVG